MDLGVSRVSGVCIPSSVLTLFCPDFIASGVLVLFSQLDFKLLSVVVLYFSLWWFLGTALDTNMRTEPCTVMMMSFQKLSTFVYQQRDQEHPTNAPFESLSPQRDRYSDF